MSKLICSTCGKGDKLQRKAWVLSNGNKYVDDAVFDGDDLWCQRCEAHTDQISEDEYYELKHSI